MGRISPNVLHRIMDMDRAIESGDVMPPTWAGYARLKAYDQTDSLSDEARAFAVSLADTVAEKNPDASGETVASKVVEKTRERFDA